MKYSAKRLLFEIFSIIQFNTFYHKNTASPDDTSGDAVFLHVIHLVV